MELRSSALPSVDPEFGTAYVSCLPLQLQNPVPSDLEIARAQRPKPITTLALELGILDSELHLFGSHKAKVCAHVRARSHDWEGADACGSYMGGTL